MKKSVIKALLAISLVINIHMALATQSVHDDDTIHYHDYEIQELLSHSATKQHSSHYIQNYFSSKNPKVVIDHLFKADMSPLKREYIFYNLLTEISQQPPQDFHQDLVDQMKAYEVKATHTAQEGHQAAAIFNLNSKAYGIENIWTAYRTEQNFNQLFATNIPLAVTNIKNILSEDSRSRRPQWLGVKNSLDALPATSMSQLSSHLLTMKANTGLGHLTSYVALKTGHIGLIDQALSSALSEVRQFTLRHLSSHLPPEQTKSVLLFYAQNGQEQNFSISLLGQMTSDDETLHFLIDQLKHKTTASNAAFALSQSENLKLPELLKKRYLKSNNNTEKNHLLLALKLNQLNSSQLALNELLQYIEKGSSSEQWLKSFETNIHGGES